MIREINRDIIFLERKSQKATIDDIAVGKDLLDTLKANKEKCVGMAANMIGVSKSIIVFSENESFFVMYNPVMIKCAGSFQAEEGCLSLDGTRKTKRYKTIKVQYQNEKFQTRIKTYHGWTAQIIQHEIDHCNGVVI